MKLACPCGATLSDNTDFLSYKAHVVADQDWGDLTEQFERGGEAAWRSAEEFHAATLYQCNRCKRLFVWRGSDPVVVFAPEGQSPDLLQSVKGEDWPRPLVGHWRDGAGELHWGFTASPQGDNGWRTDFASWPQLESAYQEVFERLRAAGRLRSALLRRDGATVHEWPEQA